MTPALSSLLALLPGAPGWSRAGSMDASVHLNERLLGLIMVARAIALAMGLVALALAVSAEWTVLPWALVAVAAMVMVVAFSATARHSRPTQNQLLGEIALDIVMLTVVLSMVGRDTPFDYLYLMPLVMGACAFSGWRAAVVAGLVAAGWMTIHLFDTNGSRAYAMAIGGHLAIGAFVAYFSFAGARLVRRHERAASRTRERAISAMGARAQESAATRVAHALSTPLGTMAIIVADLREGRLAPEERDAALETLAGQIAACKLHLSALLDAAGVRRGEGAYRSDIFEILSEIREECLLHQPNGSLELLSPYVSGPPREVLMELSLFEALAAVVKDQLSTPPHAVNVTTGWDDAGVLVDIRRNAAAPRATNTDPRDMERLAMLAALLEGHGGSLSTGPADRLLVRLPYADRDNGGAHTTRELH